MEIYRMFYKINQNNNVNDNSIRILGKEFIKTNKNKGIIIYTNKKYPLKELFNIKNIESKKLKINMLLTKNSYNKSFMFNNCSSLLTFELFNDIYEKEDTSLANKNNKYIGSEEEKKVYDDYKWSTKISSMNEMFSNCSSLISLPDISKWDTSEVKNMSKIFSNCIKLASLPDISKWNTGNVLDMSKMFYNCSSLSTFPDISKWNLNNIPNTDKMFYNCSSLSSSPNVSKLKKIK